MEVRKIGPEYARTLGRLEAEIYPPEFCLGWQDFLEDLQEAESENGNFSFGLFEEGQMVGYLVAYREDNHIFVSDLAILPFYRVKSLVALLSSFFNAASKTKLLINADCRENSYRVCQHQKFFRQFGYILAYSRTVAPYNGEISWEVRFDYIDNK